MSAPGIRRDGTLFDGREHTDGQWVRWQRGKPRKMGGYNQVSRRLSGIVRGLDAFPDDGNIYVRMGSQSVLEVVTVNASTGVATVVSDVTPAAFATSDNNMWQFAQMFNATTDIETGDMYSLAHATPSAMDITSETDAPVYYGAIRGTSAFTAITSSSVAGGICVLHPYLCIFGADGYFANSVANLPLDMTGSGSNSARITAKKLVRGMAVRGGAGQAPAGLLWSLDSLIRATYIGGSPVFDFDTISDSIDIIAANSVVEYGGVFYWIGIERFMMFNGVVQDLPNPMNSNFFFDNLNWDYANTIFSFKVRRFGEIWWCFPKGDSTYPDHAIVFNVTERTWYDTPLPNGGRAAAVNIANYRYPLMSGVDPDDATSKTILWQHEIGVDEVSGSPVQTKAIRSFYETGIISAVRPEEGGKPTNRALVVSLVEPDFVQTGDMTLTIVGRSVAQGGDVESSPRTFAAEPSMPAEETMGFKDVNYRELRFRFESNVAGGNYQAGSPIAHVSPGTGTVLGKTA